jgi:methionine biosynthesis protein MetW
MTTEKHFHPPILRPDLQMIADLVARESSVLDVGCNDGTLLKWLEENKHVRARGIELSQDGVSACLAKGLAVIQGDANSDLSYYPDQSVDYVILSQTLQALNNPSHVLKEMVRIGKRAILSVPNFGHWKNRAYLTLHGRMPVTRDLSYEWYDTPNIHFCTILDFIVLCEKLGITIEQQLYTSGTGKPQPFSGKNRMANLVGKQGVFVVKK